VCRVHLPGPMKFSSCSGFAAGIALFACSVSPAFASSQEFMGKVVGVADGDTLTVLHNGKPQHVSLNGIDCPEKAQPFGLRAKNFTSGLAFGQMVTIKPTARDKQGRTFADVVLPDGRLLQYELIKAGLAWWYSRREVDQRLRDLQEEARLAKRGLWVDPNPIPPWDWRRRLEPGRPKNERNTQ
jgi:endonuclease YncB( thermonuclease family)